MKYFLITTLTTLLFIGSTTIKAQDVTDPCERLGGNCLNTCRDFVAIDETYIYYTALQYTYSGLASKLKDNIDAYNISIGDLNNSEAKVESDFQTEKTSYIKAGPNKAKLEKLKNTYDKKKIQLVKQEEALKNSYYKLLSAVYNYKVKDLIVEFKEKEEKRIQVDYPNSGKEYIESRINKNEISSAAIKKAEDYIIVYDLTEKCSYAEKWFDIVLTQTITKQTPKLSYESSRIYHIPPIGLPSTDVATSYKKNSDENDISTTIRNNLKLLDSDIQKYKTEVLNPAKVETQSYYDKNTASVIRFPVIQKLPKIDATMKALEEELTKYEKIKTDFLGYALERYEAESYVAGGPSKKLEDTAADLKNKKKIYSKFSDLDQKALTKLNGEILPSISATITKLEKERTSKFFSLSTTCDEETQKSIKNRTVKFRQQKRKDLEDRLKNQYQSDGFMNKDSLKDHSESLKKSMIFFNEQNFYSNI